MAHFKQNNTQKALLTSPISIQVPSLNSAPGSSKPKTPACTSHGDSTEARVTSITSTREAAQPCGRAATIAHIG